MRFLFMDEHEERPEDRERRYGLDVVWVPTFQGGVLLAKTRKVYDNGKCSWLPSAGSVGMQAQPGAHAQPEHKHPYLPADRASFEEVEHGGLLLIRSAGTRGAFACAFYACPDAEQPEHRVMWGVPINPGPAAAKPSVSCQDPSWCRKAGSPLGTRAGRPFIRSRPSSCCLSLRSMRGILNRRKVCFDSVLFCSVHFHQKPTIT